MYRLAIILSIVVVFTSLTARADWPMSGANPQRTSWTSDEVGGSLSTYKMKWARPIEAFISAHVNLVCTNGMIYVSTARGVVALDAVSGAVNWQYDTQMPMGDAPTYDNGYLYAPGCDRRIHKINANTGAGVWTSDYAEAAFYTNPLIVGSVVYATNRDGRLYAINASTGAVNWTYPSAEDNPLGPIMFSPSYSSGVIYFCSNDMHAYGVDTSGNLVWQSPKLPGVQFQSWWPTVYGDYLLIPVAHAYRFDQSPGSRSVTVQTAGENGSMIEIENDAFFPGDPDASGLYVGPVVSNPPGTWHHNRTVRDYSAMCEYLEDNPNPVTMRHWPWMRQMVVLYRSNGQEYTMDTDGDGYPEYAPILYCGTKNGQVQPPVVNGNDNVIYVNNLYSSSPTDAGGRFESLGWNFGTQYFSYTSGANSAMAESQVLSGGGNLLYRNMLCDRQGDYKNVFTGATGAYWQQGYGKPHNFTNAPRSDRMWAYKAGESDLAGFYGKIDDVASHNGAYHNHGGDQNPLIPYIYNAVGRIYSHRSNAVVCFAPEGTMTPSTPGDPLPLAMFNRSKVDTLTSPTVANLKARLAREIQKIVDLPEGDMTPGHYCVGQAVSAIRALTQYFENPGDDLYVLSKAYQQLGDYPALQAELEAYLANQWSEYFSPTAYGKRGWDIGAERTQMLLPLDIEADMNTKAKSVSATGWASWTYPQYNMYAMYEYANAFPSLASTIYTRAKALIAWNYPALSQDTIYEYNAWIMGYEGFLKLQELAGQTGDVVGGRTRADIQNIRDTMMLTRANNFQKDSPYPMSTGLWRKFNFCRNFMFLCPELGDYFYNNIGTQVQDAWEEYNFVAPYWMMARYTADPQEGTMSVLYHYHAMFQAAAHALKLPYDELVKYLDVPAFNVGDMFYIDNLVTAIQTPHSGPTMEPEGGGTYVDPVTVTITMPSAPDANLYYTVDGSEPDDSDTLYTAPLVLTVNTTVKAIAYTSGQPSGVTSVVFTIDTGIANQPPAVGAGSDQAIQLPDNTVNLRGSVYDATLAFPVLSITTSWSKTSGPGTVTFDNDAALSTTATFSTDGDYVLRLTAHEGGLAAFDEVTIAVAPKTNEAPIVNAGIDQEVILPVNTVSLTGSVTDDGLPDPPPAVRTTWSKLSGEGEVVFSDVSQAVTTAMFSGSGTYVLQLDANDGQFTASDTMTVIVRPPLQAGTVAHLKLDDGGGTVAVDSSGNGNNGTVGGGAAWSSGVANGALTFDGVNDVVTIASTWMLDSPKGTWSLWVKTDGNWGVDGDSGGTTTKGNCVAMTRHNATSSRQGAGIIITDVGKVRLQCKKDTSQVNVDSVGTVTNNMWHHIAVTYDQSSGGALKVYIDGVPDGSGASPWPWTFNGQNMLVGDSPDAFWEEFAGQIDDVQIYNFVLSNGDIAMLHNNAGHAKQAGDINSSGAIDEVDLEIMAAQWLQPPGVPSADICPPPSGDGAVDMLDLAVLANNWLD